MTLAPPSGEPPPAQARTESGRLLALEPLARELAAEAELDGVRGILSRGNGSDRQLRIFNANRDVVEVVREIADATEPVGAERVAA